MPRRGDTDPLLLQAVSERLARLLAETQPRRAVDDAGLPSPGAGSNATDGLGETELVEVDDLPPPRRFGRRHLGVVCVLLLAGLVWAGWSMLRARPVALASPVTVSVSAVPAPSPTVASALPTAGTPTPSAVGASTATPGALVVHVLGAVRRPGLVTLGERARVQDAVDAAGGFTRNADAGDLNLAQLLQDGQQVVIGTAARPTGDIRGGGGTGGGASAGPGAAGSGGDATGPGTPLDLNAATVAQLEELPGVGPVTAGKITAWRTEHGRFSRVEELQEVDGIGPKTYAEIAPHVRV